VVAGHQACPAMVSSIGRSGARAAAAAAVAVGGGGVALALGWGGYGADGRLPSSPSSFRLPRTTASVAPPLSLRGDGAAEECCRQLESTGICVVEGVLPPAHIAYWSRVAGEAWATHGQLASGRMHSDLMDAAHWRTEAQHHVQEPLRPVVRQFLREGPEPGAANVCGGGGGGGGLGGVRRGVGGVESEPGAEGGRDSWRLTQCQLVDALPGCPAQMWHVDNTARGLTVLVPLVPTTTSNGPTELFPGSSTIWATSSQGGRPATPLRALGALLAGVRSHAGRDMMPVPATVPAGAAIVYDSRTIHRGGANCTEQRRPALVLRFDRSDSPPPGIGIAGTFLVRVGSWWIAGG
jgi:hypothetical protein